MLKTYGCDIQATMCTNIGLDAGEMLKLWTAVNAVIFTVIVVLSMRSGKWKVSDYNKFMLCTGQL